MRLLKGTTGLRRWIDKAIVRRQYMYSTEKSHRANVLDDSRFSHADRERWARIHRDDLLKALGLFSNTEIMQMNGRAEIIARKKSGRSELG